MDITIEHGSFYASWNVAKHHATTPNYINHGPVAHQMSVSHSTFWVYTSTLNTDN